MPLVVDGRPSLRRMTRHFNVPFCLFPVAGRAGRRRRHGRVRLLTGRGVAFVMLTHCVRIVSRRVVGTCPGGVVGVRRSFLPTFINTGPCRTTFRENIGVVNTADRCMAARLSTNPVVRRSMIHVARGSSVRSLMGGKGSLRGVILSHTMRGRVRHGILTCGGGAMVFD